jgi:hypothetical protein
VVEDLLGEEIKDVAKVRCASLVDLRVLTPCTCDGGELFVLHIEYLSQHTPGRLEDIGLELDIVTLRATPIFMPHGLLFSFFSVDPVLNVSTDGGNLLSVQGPPIQITHFF